MKKIVILNILILVLLLQGCEKKASPGPSASSTYKPSATKTEQKETKFDIEKVRKELSLNGKKFSLPCSVKDLGKEYYLNYDTIVKDEAKDGTIENFFSQLCLKNEVGSPINQSITISVKNEKKKKYEDMQIRYISVDEDCRENFDFKIGPIGFDSTKKEVLKQFGEPSQKQKTDKLPDYIGYFYEAEQGYMQISFQKERIDEMVFKYKG